jgi:Zn-dependent protease with chaperone function
VRTVLYPITTLLGPFANDAIGQVLKNPYGDGEDDFSRLAALHASCSSRRLELEADLVGLRSVLSGSLKTGPCPFFLTMVVLQNRLLANAGIDPRIALQFWEERIPSLSEPQSATDAPVDFPEAAKLHSALQASPLLRSHPVDEQRIEGIRDELERWRRFAQHAAAS